MLDTPGAESVSRIVRLESHAMRVIITGQSAVEVTKIEKSPAETIFRLADGQVLCVGVRPEKLQAQLSRIKSIPGIDLSQPPSTQPEIFYEPFMARSVYDVVWPIVRMDPAVQNHFRGHPKLQGVAQLGYKELRELPLEAYVSGPFGLYLGHPYNFVSRAADPTLADGSNEYRCNFRDQDCLVKVFINLRTRAVTVTQ